ncbi:arylsulfatase [Planctomycetes bacterium K23_9]|uniref:Arylsulfatase n=1 Tax=Stieleria marina TaxID=1930275 RepID=A0A517NU73_9BACT|nr:Arylsulfatase [Planctomycetes bacterium K23_9]
MNHPFGTATLAIVFALTTSWMAQAAEKPNIIYIMSDDMGFSDIGCYGSEIKTPHLDSLAENGLRFTQFYNTARCCPTRASLLTGLYPHQAGIGHMMNDRGHDGYRGELNRSCVTIPEALHSAGYKNYMAGKWHVTTKIAPKQESDKDNWPRQRGFDRFYGTIHGAGSFFDPNTLTRENTYISPVTDPEYPRSARTNGDYYYTDAIADHASRYIHEHHTDEGDKPFFMYVSFTAAHWPMHALPRDIQKYQGKYDAGYDTIRNARYAKMVQLGLIDSDSTVNWTIPDDWKNDDQWDWDKRNMEVYAAMIDNMDQGIGRIVESLKDTGQFENTLICFFQDNGGCAEGYGRRGTGGPRAELPTLPPLADDYLQPNMTPTQSRDGFPMRTGVGTMAGPADTAIGYGKAWATVSNTPFREYKHWTHEGGISTPLIIHWPDKITRAGELETVPSHLIDLMATAVDVAGAEYPQTFHDGNDIKPMEGVSLLPLLTGKPIQREAIYWEHEGNRAIRLGDFKLVAKGVNGNWELYNIANDRSEQNDLSQSEPERVKEMAAMWQTYAKRANVLPLNPRSRANHQAANTNKRFELSGDANLEGGQAPFVRGRRINVSADVDIHGDGVIVAQGGVTHGWSLYVKDGTLQFAAARNGKRSTLDSKVAIQGRHKVSATLGTLGAITIHVDEKKVASERIAGCLVEQPVDGLQVGQDTNGAVGDYKAPFALIGDVDKVILKLKP